MPTSLKQKYSTQKRRALMRGIDWLFTFDSWLDWWGDDLIFRGQRVGSLQMQRIADEGPYSPQNCRKGVPKQNGETRSRMLIAKRSKAERQRILAAEMAAPCVEP